MTTKTGNATHGLSSFKDYLNEELRDINYAVAFLNTALDEEDQETFLLCLRDVVRANDGFEMTAENAEIGRTALYKMLSEEGNPRFDSLLALLNQLGIKLTLAVA